MRALQLADRAHLAPGEEGCASTSCSSSHEQQQTMMPGDVTMIIADRAVRDGWRSLMSMSDRHVGGDLGLSSLLVRGSQATLATS